MPFYNNLNPRKREDRWTAVGLLRLRRAIRKTVPAKRMDGRLLLATWNIREFGGKKFKGRSKEALFYIAEVMSAFDLVAVQEVRSDLADFNRLMRILGGWWRYLVTDVTLGRRGNEERLAFLYDSRKVTFGGFASQVVVPPKAKKQTVAPAEQLARTPFVVGFRCGWLKFTICTAHILYGKGVAAPLERVQEIRALAQLLAERAKHPDAWAKNMIVLGDFNIFKPTDETFKALTSAKFVVPKHLEGMTSNAAKGKHFDQIAFIAPDLEDKLELSTAGVLNIFETVFTDKKKDQEFYAAAKGKAPFRTWRTYQLSDHLPMWIELRTDFSGKYLREKMRPTGPAALHIADAAPSTTG